MGQWYVPVIPKSPLYGAKRVGKVWKWRPVAPAQLRHYSPWYNGFVDETNIVIKASREPALPRQNFAVYAPFQFDFFPPGVGHPIGATSFISHVAVATHEHSKPETTIPIARRITWDEAMARNPPPGDPIAEQARLSLEEMPEDRALYNPTEDINELRTSLLFECPQNANWLACPTRDDFANIVLTNLDKFSVRIWHIKITLNATTILDNSYDVLLGPQEHLALANDIAEFRRRAVRQHLNILTWPPLPLPKILEVASQEIGKSYDIKYRGGWHGPGPERDHWVYGPVSFCTEFAVWAIRQATDLQPPQLDFWDIEGNLSLQSMAEFFCDEGRWLGVPPGGAEGSTTVPYEQLGEHVKAGDYCSILKPDNSGGHAMFFIGWCDRSGNLASFDPDPPSIDPGDPTKRYNYFWSVSGNWNMLNTVAKFSISNSTYEPDDDISLVRWGYECNGFGMLR